jgi:hypothetical protein
VLRVPGRAAGGENLADVAHDNPLTTPPGVHYGPSVTQAIRPRSFLGGKTEGRLSEREVSNLALGSGASATVQFSVSYGEEKLQKRAITQDNMVSEDSS